jgi:biotin carboxylase
MNFVHLSPHFPPNYTRFCFHLHQLGANVLGLADEPYQQLSPELVSSLSEYYLVNNMHNYDELLRALGYFTHRYGKIDRIDSFNEYWLETESQLRTDFNIFGIKNDQIHRIKRKSLMKETFQRVNVPAARGRVVHSLPDARKLIRSIGYPVVAKPDIGVGAAKTFKIHQDIELESFFAQKSDVDYILEEFINGTILTFDGLTDQEGNLVFSNSLQYSQGIMETVNNDDQISYYTLREIPKDLDEIGRKVLKAFDVKERFFHFEFFRTPQNKLIALEVNMRPPGGLTTDMFNYSNDIDIYAEWAHLIMHHRFAVVASRPYHCCYVGRKKNRSYATRHDEILSNLGERVCYHTSISGVFSAALGDYGYLVRSPYFEEIQEMVAYIQAYA